MKVNAIPPCTNLLKSLSVDEIHDDHENAGYNTIGIQKDHRFRKGINQGLYMLSSWIGVFITIVIIVLLICAWLILSERFKNINTGSYN